MTQKRSGVLELAVQTVKAATVAVLCGVMVVPPALAVDGVDTKVALPAEKPVGPLNQQQRVLHALNRFTFGPRPGDEAAVSKMGSRRGSCSSYSRRRSTMGRLRNG